MRDREQPLDQRQPAIHLARVRVGEFEVDRLLFVRRGITVVQQGQVRRDAIGEAHQVEVPVEPPARILLTKYQHEHQRHEDRGSADDQ